MTDYSDVNTDARHKLMERAFALVKPPNDWKAKIDTYIVDSDLRRANVTLENVREAISYFTATGATIVTTTGGYRILSVGYRAGLAGP